MILMKICFNIDTAFVIFDLIFAETKIVWHSFINIWYLWQHICRQRFCAFSQVMKRKSSWLTIIREQKFSLSKKFERLGFLRHVVLFCSCHLTRQKSAFILCWHVWKMRFLYMFAFIIFPDWSIFNEMLIFFELCNDNYCPRLK